MFFAAPGRAQRAPPARAVPAAAAAAVGLLVAVLAGPADASCSYCVNDCDSYGDSDTGGTRGTYWCDLEDETVFETHFDYVGGEHCFTKYETASADYYRLSYEDYFTSPYPNSIKQKCGEYCVNIGTNCRGFTIRSRDGQEGCYVHATNPDQYLSSSSYGFNGPFDEENGITIATTGFGATGSVQCYVKAGRLSDYTTTSTTVLTTKTRTTTTKTTSLDASEYRPWDSTKTRKGPAMLTTAGPVATVDDGPKPDDISDQFVFGDSGASSDVIFDAAGSGSVVVVKSHFQSAPDDGGDQIDLDGIIGFGDAIELTNGGANGFVSVADVASARAELAAAGRSPIAAKANRVAQVGQATVQMTRGAIVVAIDDAAALAQIEHAAELAFSELSLGVGPRYTPGRGGRARKDTGGSGEASGDIVPPAQPHAGWVRKLLGDAAYADLYAPGEMDNVQVFVARQRRPGDGQQFSPAVRERNAFADVRERVGIAAGEPVIFIFSPKRTGAAATGSGGRDGSARPPISAGVRHVNEAKKLIRAGCFKQKRSAVGIQFVEQTFGYGVKFGLVFGEHGCATVKDWCTGDATAGAGKPVDFSRTQKIGPPLDRCVIPVPCRSKYDPTKPVSQQQRSCLQMEPCSDEAVCPAPIKSSSALAAEAAAAAGPPGPSPVAQPTTPAPSGSGAAVPGQNPAAQPTTPAPAPAGANERSTSSAARTRCTAAVQLGLLAGAAVLAILGVTV